MSKSDNEDWFERADMPIELDDLDDDSSKPATPPRVGDDSACEEMPIGVQKGRKRKPAKRNRVGRPQVGLFSGQNAEHARLVQNGKRALALQQFRARRYYHPDYYYWENRAKAGEKQEDVYACKFSQFAMFLLEPKRPFNWEQKTAHSLDLQAMCFLGWLNEHLEQRSARQTGPKRDVLRTWKTALSLVVARTLAAKARDFRKPPSAREVANAWYRIFGEEESRNAIKSRLRAVARLCAEFAKEEPALREDFRKAGDAILRPRPKPRQRRRASGPNS